MGNNVNGTLNQFEISLLNVNLVRNKRNVAYIGQFAMKSYNKLWVLYNTGTETLEILKQLQKKTTFPALSDCVIKRETFICLILLIYNFINNLSKKKKIIIYASL